MDTGGKRSTECCGPVEGAESPCVILMQLSQIVRCKVVIRPGKGVTVGIQTIRICVCSVALTIVVRIWWKKSAKDDDTFGFVSGTEEVR